MSSSGSNTGMETYVPLVSDIVNKPNAVFHSSPHINQMLPQIIHVPHLCLVHSLLNCAPDFVVNWLRQWLFRGHKPSWSDECMVVGLTQLLHIRRVFRDSRSRCWCALHRTGRDVPSLSVADVLNGGLYHLPGRVSTLRSLNCIQWIGWLFSN